MGFRCGIVGLPNVGKSTLFNALTKTMAAEAANYPFCTIEPNVGRVSVPDERLQKLAEIAASANILGTQIEFVDIAGLVKGASKGEGLGNQFLANIREVDAIVHVVRCFENDDITHVDGKIDPLRDIETIETELMLSDLESLEKRLPNMEKKKRAGDKSVAQSIPVIEKILEVLRKGFAARTAILDEEEHSIAQQLQLLTFKPILYLCNVSEDEAATGNGYTQAVAEFATKHDAKAVAISAAIEAEISMLECEEEKQEFLQSIGLEETGLSRVIRAGYALLGLLTFFTVGPKEARAWTVRKGAKAPEAAGAIHTDFERGFICAETCKSSDYIEYGSEQAIKAQGKMRQEGREYIVQDGDVFLFRFNV